MTHQIILSKHEHIIKTEGIRYNNAAGEVLLAVSTEESGTLVTAHLTPKAARRLSGALISASTTAEKNLRY